MSEAHRKRLPIASVRFWKKVKKGLGKACWEWIGDKYPDGYGRFWYKGDNWRVNRVVWELYNGSIPEGMQVLHRCDNPLCVRLTHLFLGTYRDNIDDMVAKGRSIKGEKSCQAKLTEAQAIEVLQWFPGCGVRLKYLMYKFGVSGSCVELIRSGRNWKHLYHLHSKFHQ